MRLLLVAIACLAISTFTEKASAAANAHHKYIRPTIKFSPAIFTVSYGTTTNLCVTVNPSSSVSLFMDTNAWHSDVPGVFAPVPGSNPSCTGPGKLFLSVRSVITDVCLAGGSVSGILNNHPAGSVVGNVLLPTQEFSALKDNSSSQNVISADWRITFTDSSGAANFNGLQNVGEHLFISPGDPNDCHMGVGAQFETHDWVLGPVTAGGNTLRNSLVDSTAKQAESPTCTSIVSQRFQIGRCTIPIVSAPPTKITFRFTAGAPSLIRSDGGQ